jgi:hypothetical protein
MLPRVVRATAVAALLLLLHAAAVAAAADGCFALPAEPVGPPPIPPPPAADWTWAATVLQPWGQA